MTIKDWQFVFFWVGIALILQLLSIIITHKDIANSMLENLKLIGVIN